MEAIMRGVNKVILIGNLGRDPETRYTKDGKAVANFTLATSESWKDQQGERQERTEWHRIVAFGKLAEIANQYLTKGKQVYLEGRLQTNAWEDKDGNKRSTTEIRMDQMIMLGGRGTDGPSQDAVAPPPSEDYGQPFKATDEDVPF